MARLDEVHAAAGFSGTDFDVLIRLARSPDHRLRMLTDEGLERLTAHLPGLFAAIDSALVDVLRLDELDQLVGILRVLRERLHPGATAGA